ncbi:hypothetical protein EMCRGX_G029696 [Ephydatia muelleri]
MGKCASLTYKRLASLLSTKKEQNYGATIAWIRCCLSFSLLRSSIMCLRGARSSQGRAFRSSVIDLAVTEAKATRLICDASEKEKILHACHSDPISGHLGIKKTIKRIRERFTWKGLNKQVIELVSSCEFLTWYHVAIDFIGPISPMSLSGNRYILTLSDYFSKWVEAVATPSKEAHQVASTLYK